MANTILEIRDLATGLAGLTCDLFPADSDTATVTGIALTEETNRKGVYRGTVAGALNGEFFVLTNTNLHRVVYLRDDTNVYVAVKNGDMDPTAGVVWGVLAASFPEGQVLAHAGNTPTTLETDLDTALGYASSQLVGGLLVFVTGTFRGVFAGISQFQGSTAPNVTLDRALGGTPAAGDRFVVIPSSLMRGTNAASTHSPSDVVTALEGATLLPGIATVAAKFQFNGSNDVKATLDGESVDVGAIGGEADAALALVDSTMQMLEGSVDLVQTLLGFRCPEGVLVFSNTDQLKNRRILWTSGTLEGSSQRIAACVRTGSPVKTFITLQDAMPASPSVSDTFRVI